jgi:hypothetical protein
MKSMNIEKLVALGDLRFSSKKTYRIYLKQLSGQEIKEKIRKKSCILEATSKAQIKSTKQC